MKNKMEDLRNHLFAALEGLSDPVDAPLDLAAGGETSAPLRLPDEPYQQGPRLVDK